MKEIISDVDTWREANESIALATVVETWGSAPRKVGAKMALTPAGAISGSVSGGCVEGAVFEEGTEALQTGSPRLLHFGVADETAWEVGLACGGTIEVFVEPLHGEVYDFLHRLIDKDQAGAAVTIIRGPEALLGQKLAISRTGETVGHLDGVLEEKALEAARAARYSQRLQLTDDVEIFIDVLRPPRMLVMVGGVHIAIALTDIARVLGYNTVVVDPRRAFGSQERFPHVGRLIQAWPDKAFDEIEVTPETAVTLLTHDPKIDDAALKIVLNSSAFYIGALGSTRTHAKRQQRLREMGFSDEQIGRICAPIGLDIGAETPEEIALAIMAEIVRAERSS